MYFGCQNDKILIYCEIRGEKVQKTVNADEVKVKGLLLAAFGSASWGVSGVCSQYLFMTYDIDSSWLTAIRMVYSGIALLILALPKEKGKIFQIWKKGTDIRDLLIFAFFGLLLCSYSYLSAVRFSNSATATVLQNLNVVFMAVTMAVWQKTHIGKYHIAAILLAVAGTYLIATGGDSTTMKLSPAGLAFGLLAAAGVVTYTLLSRPVVKKWGNLLGTGWGMLAGGSVIFITSRAWVFPEGFTLFAWLMLFMIVLVGGAFGFAAFLEGVKYIGPVKATLIGTLEPASATVLSALFLGTRFSFPELVGFGCIILTVFISSSKKCRIE